MGVKRALSNALPPRWIRRVVLAPAIIAVTVLVLVTLPLWLMAAAAVSPLLPGKLRALRVLKWWRARPAAAG